MKNTVKIGLIFLGSIFLLYLAMVWGTQSHFLYSNYNTYYIDFENVNGLKISDPVLIRGLTVGHVTSIELQEDFCRVEIKLKREYPLKNQTQAEIQIRELLSGKQLVLFPSGQKILPDKSIIKGNATFDFSFALSKFGKLVGILESQNVDIQKITVWLSKLDSILNEPDFLQIPQQIYQTLFHYDQIAIKIQKNHVIEHLDSATIQIQSLLKDFSRTQQYLDEFLIGIKPLIPKADTTLFKLDSILTDSHRLLKKLQDSFDKIQNQETVINAILFKEEFYKDIQKTLLNLNQTLDHIREKRIRVIAKMWGKE